MFQKQRVHSSFIGNNWVADTVNMYMVCNIQYVCVVIRIIEKVVNKNLKEWFVNSYIFSNYDIDKFTLLLWIYGWLGNIQWNFITWKRT